jgi:sensor c-di-GMP phosphodiesterase-like protein
VFTQDEIRAALENNEFFLEYLPIVCLEDGRCVGGEALVRWKQAERIVPPMEFIPLVEGTILAGLLTYRVIELVAEEMGEWLRETQDIYISINVPPELWGRGGVNYALQKSHLAEHKDRIVLEVTERGVPDKLGVETINNHGYMNVRIALDDVMANEAYLIFLARLKVDVIKIDRHFADRILAPGWPTREDEVFLRLCAESDRTIIVEGVEQAEQVIVLRDAGVRYAQGWHFSRALPADAFKAYYAAHPGSGMAPVQS